MQNTIAKTYETWDRPLNEMEYRILFFLFREVAFFCDFVRAKI